VTAFFIPGVSNEESAIEAAYGDMRRQIELDMGRLPNGRRISTLWTRRGRLDCVTEVGRRDPLHDGTVVAIFDMGNHRPFVIWWQPDILTDQGVREVLGCSAYSVSEFDT
jgi:hypothetical protein